MVNTIETVFGRNRLLSARGQHREPGVVLRVGEQEGREAESPGSQVALAEGAEAGRAVLGPAAGHLLPGQIPCDYLEHPAWGSKHPELSLLWAKAQGTGAGADGSPPHSAQPLAGDPCMVPTLGTRVRRGAGIWKGRWRTQSTVMN